jgi:hypothetical protein
MKRRLFTVAAMLACLLAVGVATSWVLSYSVYYQLSCGSGLDRYRCTWKSYGASFQFPRWPPGIPEGASRAVLICFGKILLEQASYSEEPLPAMASRGYGWSSDENVIPNFSYFHAVTADMSRRGHWTVRQVTLPHWAVLLLFALLPAAWLFAWRRRAVGYRPKRTQGTQ